jgi:hypothetical protein
MGHHSGTPFNGGQENGMVQPTPTVRLSSRLVESGWILFLQMPCQDPKSFIETFPTWQSDGLKVRWLFMACGDWLTPNRIWTTGFANTGEWTLA